MTPFTVMPGAVTAYTVSLYNSTQECGPKKEDKNSSLTDGKFHTNSNANPTFEQRHGYKCTLAIPNGSDDKTSARQRQKKLRCEGKVDITAKEKTGMRIFCLKNTTINPSEVF